MLRTAWVPATCSPPMKLLKTATMLSLEKSGSPAVGRAAVRPIDGQGPGRRQAARLGGELGAQPAQAALHVFLVEIGAAQPAIALIGIAGMQRAPVVEHHRIAWRQPAAILHPRVVDVGREGL